MQKLVPLKVMQTQVLVTKILKSGMQELKVELMCDERPWKPIDVN